MPFNPKVDNYIENAAPFAQEILIHLRKLVHQACPEVQEVIKWNFPCFEYKGPLANMAGFKQHCTFGFWKSSLLRDPEGVLIDERGKGMGHFGKIESLAGLPPDEIILDLLAQAVELNEKGIKVKKTVKKAVTKAIPDDLHEALQQHPKAIHTYQNFSPSQHNDYIDWITGAKREATRTKRLETTIEWLSEGKRRNWKYE
jgi:uncharacterized protein YdeI (YjbR/CyaY-like superfamily)